MDTIDTVEQLEEIVERAQPGALTADERHEFCTAVLGNIRMAGLRGAAKARALADAQCTGAA